MPIGTVHETPTALVEAPRLSHTTQAPDAPAGEWHGRRVSGGPDSQSLPLASVLANGDAASHRSANAPRSLAARVVRRLGAMAKLPSMAIRAAAARFQSPGGVGSGIRSDSALAQQDGLAAERLAVRASRGDGPQALGAVPARLAGFLADNVSSLPGSMATELGVAVEFANQLDRDLGKVAELVDKSHAQPLGDDERRELTTLVASNKHNVRVALAWVEGQQRLGLGEPAKKMLNDLQTNFQESMVDLADIAALSDLDETADEPVSRSERANAHLQYAEAALSVAQALAIPGLEDSAKQQLIGDLQAHRDELAQIQGVANGKIDTPGDELRLAARAHWDAPLTLVKFQDGDDKALSALRKQWSQPSSSINGGLPITHPKVGQARMLREFMGQRLLQAGVAKDRLPDLKAMQNQAFNEVLDHQPWEAIHTRVATTLPNSNGERTVVRSHIVPAKALSAHFAEDYAGNGVNCGNRTQYKHVPNLAQTSVTNDQGRTLFSGLRHGVLDAYRIDARFLGHLPDGELKQMIGDLLVREGSVPESNREDRIDAMFAAIRRNPKEASALAHAMREQASQDMAKELAVASLASDPAKFQKALAGQTVAIDLTSVSLVTPDNLRSGSGSERSMLSMQQQALAKLQDSPTVQLPVRDAEGVPRTVSANVRVRQFNFGVNQGAVGSFQGGPIRLRAGHPGIRKLMGWNFAMQVNDPNLTKLLGPSNASGVGGDLAGGVEQLKARAAECEDMIEGMRAQLSRTATADPPRGPSMSAHSERVALLSGLETQRDTLLRNARTLSEAGEQLKSLWATGGFRDGEHDPYKMVSRLALVGHLMGEATLFNCKSGKDRTGQLDAEVKYLATYADQHGGALPPLGEDTASSRPSRSDFTLHTGNLEMQRLNTGLPGYKLSGVRGLNDLVESDMKPVYRGGSSFVSS